MLTEIEKWKCLEIVRSTISKELGLIDQIIPCPELPIFSNNFGLFVTLKVKEQLRGCIGYVQAIKNLYQSLVDLASAAAFHDHRFPSLTITEINGLKIEVSILSNLIRVYNLDEIHIGRDGIFIHHPGGSGLLLPQVATQHNWDKSKFVQETCRKAGLDICLLNSPSTVLYRFEADVFCE